MDFHPLALHIGFHEPGHLRIEHGRQDGGSRVKKDHLGAPQGRERLGQLTADGPGAYKADLFYLSGLESLPQGNRIFENLEGGYTGAVPGDSGRHDRCGSGGEDQFVVGILFGLPGQEGLAEDFAGFPVDPFHFGLDDDLKPLGLPEEIRVPDHAIGRLAELVGSLDVSGNQIGHPAGPIRNVIYLGR